jgi:hypothetical protein
MEEGVDGGMSECWKEWMEKGVNVGRSERRKIGWTDGWIDRYTHTIYVHM